MNTTQSTTPNTASVNRVKRLPPAVAERIAAGEVVERPASVVKELVENSLDAGATHVSVRLEDGGKSLIEVVDNGHGMGAADLELSIERHATSKLSSLEDLDRILSLGFRGEALPSVAAVSEVSVVSRTQDADAAYELIAGDVAVRSEKPPQAQKITYGHFNHSSHGTRIQARGLFSSVPARFKFLKSQAAEVSQVRDWMERLALAYPKVGFELYSEDRKIFSLKGQTEAERVKALLSDGEDYPIAYAESERDGLRDRGFLARMYWIQGLSSPQNRKLVQVVNGRSLRDRFLQQAILAPFKQALMPGQFPAVALFIEMNPAALDVNVHPTKSEVRFLDKGRVFQVLDRLVKELIAKKGAAAHVATDSGGWAVGGAVRSRETGAVAESVTEPVSGTFTRAEAGPRPVIEPIAEVLQKWSAAEPQYAEKSQEKPHQKLHQKMEQAPYQKPPEAPLFHAMPQPVLRTTQNPFSSARPVGILFNTYLMYEHHLSSHSPPELILIDQHAAHERIRYEKLRKRLEPTQSSPDAQNANAAKSQLSSQSLLLPETAKFRAEDRVLLESRLPLLSQLGFEAEIFGDDTVLFRAVPIEWGSKNLPARLRNLVDRLMVTGEATLMDEALFESLASEACHSAIRAGDALDPKEAEHLFNDLFQCEHPWNCPHGRPTVVRVPERKLEEWFQRKI